MKENVKQVLISVILTILINAGFYMIIKNQIDKSENIINEKTKIITQLEKDNTKNKELIARVRKNNALNTFSSFVGNDGIVTEEIRIKKVVFNEDSWTIDITPQPKAMLKFKGDGNFTIADREVKKMLLNIVDMFKKNYYNFFDKDFREDVGILDIKGVDIIITNNNYDVGTYRDGKITLKGEK